ncbi:hypothetical protein ACLBXM_17050 [Xanthobacteraceae bacterium A53D]
MPTTQSIPIPCTAPANDNTPWTPEQRAASAAIAGAARKRIVEHQTAEKERVAASTRRLAPPANDNDPAGRHEWPCRDRLTARKLMRRPEANDAALRALVRFRGDLDALSGGSSDWMVAGEEAAVVEDVRGTCQPDLKFEFATAEHLMELYARGDLEYREHGGQPLIAHKREAGKLYVLDDRRRGERGPAQPRHPHAVQKELASRYAGAAWPRDARKPSDIFLGAQMKVGSEPRATQSPEDRLLHTAMARRAVAFIRGALPKGLYDALEASVSGETAERIGEARGHHGKYATTVGTELQRLALEALMEAYADFDGPARRHAT